MKFFDAAVHVAIAMPTLPDERPPRLTDLRDATHPTCLYYRLFDWIVNQWAPLDVVEIGTYVGTSAAHFANANFLHTIAKRLGLVTTIDINPDAKRCADDLRYPNIKAITGDSLSVLDSLAASGEKFDVLYIDGNHTFRQAYAEYFHYRRLVREGGLILIDDVGLEMDGDEMNVFWETIQEPKQRVDHLHPNVGFGIVEKRNDMRVLTPDVALDHASPIIASRRKTT